MREIGKLARKRWQVFFFFLMLIASPWFVQLIKSGWEPVWRKALIESFGQFIENIGINSSTDYLFFKGDPRLEYGTQETGPFFIFQIPLILAGFYEFFKGPEGKKKLLLVWFLITFLLSCAFRYAPDFSVGLLYFIPLQIISFFGLKFFLKKWDQGKVIKALLLLFLLFSFYEMVAFFHIFIVHYPKRFLLR